MPQKRSSRSARPAAPSTNLEARLSQLGIRNGFDLVLHLPLRYEDETAITPIGRAPAGRSVQIEGQVARVEVAYRPRRQLIVRLSDASGEAALRFFHFYGSQQKSLEGARESGARVRAFGEIRTGFFGGEMSHPRYHVLKGEEPLPQALTPVYPTTAGLSQATLRGKIEEALAETPLDETLPAPLLKRLKLMDFGKAVLALHRPAPGAEQAALVDGTHPAWTRIKFDELLAQQLSMRQHYLERKARRAPALGSAKAPVEPLLKRLPFRLTAAQERVWRDIEGDLERQHPMHRLLQGDVGSGKTIVAALAALRVAGHGLQTAVMAPTEILAGQHFRKFAEWLSPLGARVEWLTGSQLKKERTEALAAIADGSAAVVVGTHALFQKGVEFKGLGLAIVDEQHRFGVAQRLALRDKAASAKPSRRRVVPEVPAEPHVLMMSATPIPRTLSMSYYADLDVSVIDELPPGRRPVLTKLVSASRRGEVLARIRDACGAGLQAYWVCPLVEESEALDLETAIDTHRSLSEELTELNVGLVHGRMTPAEKGRVMHDFSRGIVNVLVSTTVIEVGVDVPNAALMVIEHAERFGLSQLHQLRGRVGRGTADSVCVLLYEGKPSETARARLKVIYENSDGFEIAREDLRIRGPGELLGSRQSGLPMLRFADLVRDEALVAQAAEVASFLLERHPAAAEKHLKRWLGSRAAFLMA